MESVKDLRTGTHSVVGDSERFGEKKLLLTLFRLKQPNKIPRLLHYTYFLGMIHEFFPVSINGRCSGLLLKPV